MKCPSFLFLFVYLGVARGRSPLPNICFCFLVQVRADPAAYGAAAQLREGLKDKVARVGRFLASPQQRHRF